MNTESEKRTEASTEVQKYNNMMATFRRVASRKGLKERSYKTVPDFRGEESKLKSLVDIKYQTTNNALRQSLALLSERNNYNNWGTLT